VQSNECEGGYRLSRKVVGPLPGQVFEKVSGVLREPQHCALRKAGSEWDLRNATKLGMRAELGRIMYPNIDVIVEWDVE